MSFALHRVLKKAGGLSDEQLRRVLVDSGTCVLGAIRTADHPEAHNPLTCTVKITYTTATRDLPAKNAFDFEHTPSARLGG